MYAPHPQKLMTINEFRDWTRIGRTKIYELIGSGEIQAKKIGRRTLIVTETAEDWLNAQPSYK